MLGDMTSEQFRGWYSYYQCEPFGYEIDNLRHNVKETIPEEPQDWQDTLSVAQSIMATYKRKEQLWQKN